MRTHLPASHHPVNPGLCRMSGATSGLVDMGEDASRVGRTVAMWEPLRLRPYSLRALLHAAGKGHAAPILDVIAAATFTPPHPKYTAVAELISQGYEEDPHRGYR
jgi:hypothetical protein